MVRYTRAEKIIEICEIYHRTGSIIINENVLGNLWIEHVIPGPGEKLLVWCAMSEHGIIGPFVFDGTVNSQRYREMLNNFFFPRLRALRIPLATTWFQQDGATAHCSNENLELLQSKFGDRLISRRTQHPWPPRSPDLSACDYLLWDYILEIESVREWTKQLARFATKHRA